MNLRAIDDLLETILSQWYASVALWRAPGVLSATTCAGCRDGVAATAIDVDLWPHDLIHQLDRALEAAVEQVGTSFAEEETGCAAADHRCAHELVVEVFARHAADVLDVLRQCVQPTLDHYIAEQLQWGMLDLDRMLDTR